MSDNDSERGRADGEYRDRANKRLDERLEEFEKLLDSSAECAAAVEASGSARSAVTVFERLGELKSGKTAAPAKRAASASRSLPHVHDGHRQRLRNSIKDDKKLRAFSDVQLLEVLLSFLIPQKDTNVTAHALIDKFGSVLGVLHASADELAVIPTVTADAAATLPLLAELCLYNGGDGIRILSPSDAADYFGTVYSGGECDCIFVAYLDKRFGLITVERMANADRLPIRAITDSAYKNSARYVLLVRRDASLFPAEYGLAERVNELASTLDMSGVRLLDFMMFTDYGYYTLVEPPKVGGWYVKYMFVPSVRYSRAPELSVKLEMSSGGNDAQEENARIVRGLGEFLDRLNK